MKKLLLAICFLSAFLLGGCGKEKAKRPASEMLTAFAKQKQEIPVLNTDDDIFFDFEDETIKDFAFIDDEENEITAVDPLSEVPLKTVEQELVGPEDDWDDELMLAWEDEIDADANFKVISFDLNKNSIRKDQKTIVAENVKTASEAVELGKEVVVAGHCCELGPPSFNMSLSERRAKVIRDEMVRGGVPKEKVKIIGCGSEIPIVVSDSDDKFTKIKELAPNRRAEISIN